MNEHQIGTDIVDASIHIHRTLGPGLLESVYEIILAYELEKRGLAVRRQVPVPIVYDHLTFEEGFRADLIVNDLVILELKSVTEITTAHRKQLQTYLRLTGRKLGYLLNFGEALMKDGVVRTVNNLPEPIGESEPSSG
jgi:GxxExxY protein